MLPDAAAVVVAILLFLGLIVFTFGLLGWCRSNVNTSLPIPMNEPAQVKICGFIASDSKLISSFQYKRTAEQDLEASVNTECTICLAAFEEDESVRQINSCKHIFHETCIDNWLYSRPCCPLCRTNINESTCQDSTPAAQ